jgi:hypothetical protein
MLFQTFRDHRLVFFQVDRGDIGQVAAFFIDVQPVSNDKIVWDFKTAVIDLDFHLVLADFIEQSAGFQAARVAVEQQLADGVDRIA